MGGKKKVLDWADFPPDFVKFFLNPTGCELSIRELGKGVYALLSSIPNVDNVGFVVGERGVLVIDSHISIPMARQIQERVRQVTSKPILYLVNSNYHGDHTFGNCAFPETTLVLQHRKTAELVPYMEEEKEFLFPCAGNDPKIFDGVKLRLPDIVFDDYLRLDLGGCVVELYYFGPANTPGDTITYVPHARAAWTGNMTGGGGGTFGLALESDAPTYLATLARFARTLEIETLVAAHAPLSGPSVLGQSMRYFAQVTNDVRKALSAGWTLEETLQRTPLENALSLPPSDPRAKVMEGRHRYNVQRTFLSLAGA